jgi:hypothetical protein
LRLFRAGAVKYKPPKIVLTNATCADVLPNVTSGARSSDLHRLTQPARDLEPRYNVAPTTTIDVLRVRDGTRELVPMRWGLVPAWWKKSLKEVPATFNARSETVAKKPMFPMPLGAKGTIIAWNKSFEMDVHRRMANRMPGHGRTIERMNSMFYDLKGYFSHTVLRASGI